MVGTRTRLRLREDHHHGDDVVEREIVSRRLRAYHLRTLSTEPQEIWDIDTLLELRGDCTQDLVLLVWSSAGMDRLIVRLWT